MESGYIYALKNKSFCEYLIKIGRTTRKPEIRSKEFYSGSSGVPEPFDIAFACQVCDCVIAEKTIHQKLKTYRNNNNREFFTISIEVAKKIIIDVCEEINKSSGYSQENIIIIDYQKNDNNDEGVSSEYQHQLISKSSQVVKFSLNQLSLSPAYTSSLSVEQKQRIEIVAEIFKDFIPRNIDDWILDFTRDSDPEIEILIWENIAKAFLKVSEVRYLSEEQKKEALKLLFSRSMISASKVLEETKLKTFSKKVAKEILRGYEINPIPIAVYKPNS